VAHVFLTLFSALVWNLESLARQLSKLTGLHRPQIEHCCCVAGFFSHGSITNSGYPRMPGMAAFPASTISCTPHQHAMAQHGYPRDAVGICSDHISSNKLAGVGCCSRDQRCAVMQE
jgi:hypothetical protein